MIKTHISFDRLTYVDQLIIPVVTMKTSNTENQPKKKCCPKMKANRIFFSQIPCHWTTVAANIKWKHVFFCIDFAGISRLWKKFTGKFMRYSNGVLSFLALVNLFFYDGLRHRQNKSMKFQNFKTVRPTAVTNQLWYHHFSWLLCCNSFLLGFVEPLILDR